MKILVLGSGGQVGWELQRTLLNLGEIIALDVGDLDLTDSNAIRRAVRNIKPEIIVNASAYTAVDKAEAQPELAMAVNGTAPGVLAEEAALCKSVLIHYSTDYVFDGKKGFPYTEEDEPNPLNIYGKTKLAGEKAIQEIDGPHLIFRTSWVYGLRGKNFLLTILRLAGEKEELKIVDDQIGSPTWCRMIAEMTAQIIAKKVWENSDDRGLYHLTAAGETTWFGFAQVILKYFEQYIIKSPALTAISSEEYKTPAARPAFSLLSCKKIEKKLDFFLPEWSHTLNLVFEDSNQLRDLLNKNNTLYRSDIRL